MISVEDKLYIYELISLHGHLVDDGRLDELNQVFAEDAAFDLTAFGMGIHHGLETVRSASVALGDKNPVGHHLTNVVITRIEDDDTVHARSKGIGIYVGGSADSAVYTDIIKRRSGVWRIISRKISVRHKPLAGE